METWKPIPGCEYEASSEGRIRRTKTGRVVKPFVDPLQTYGRITVYGGAKRRKVMVHRLVALAYLGPLPEGMEIDHINSNRFDNRPANLRYVTPEQNAANPITALKRAIRYQKLMLPAHSI